MPTATAKAADTLFAMNEDSLAAMMEKYVRFLEYVKVSGGDDYRRQDAAYTALDSRYSYLPELMEVNQKHMN